MLRTLEEPRRVPCPAHPDAANRACMYPSLAELEDGTLLAAQTVHAEGGVALVYVCASRDDGQNWSEPVLALPQRPEEPRADTAKLTPLGGGRVALLGYLFPLKDTAKPICNPKTGGMIEDRVVWAESDDAGRTWRAPRVIPCADAWKSHVEASAPLTVLRDGSWVSPITGFPDWEGKWHGSLCGRLLRSDDQGNAWNEDAVCMAFPGGDVLCYEQRLCQTDSGALLVIGWNERVSTGERLENHYTASFDGGRTFTAPRSTGVLGQASSLLALGGERVLALHAMRRDTSRPGILGCVVDFSDRTWRVVEKGMLWEPREAVVRNERAAEIFAYLKFGQPGAIRLRDGGVLLSFWAIEDGATRCYTARIAVD